MITIICGGRDYKFTKEDVQLLDELKTSLPITEVVCGMAQGADMEGRHWARLNNIPVKEFPANWGLHGKAAGPIRNAEMAQYADALIAFPGGKGTQNMIETAKYYGLSPTISIG